MKTLRTGTCSQCGRSGDVIAKYLPSSGTWCDQCNKKRLDDGKGVVNKAAVKSPPKGVMPNLVKELDRVFSIYVRKSDAATDGRVVCVTCGSSNDWSMMDCGHWQPRGNFAIRWDERNVAPQCRSCNRFDDGRPEYFEEHIRSHHGDEVIADLLRLKNDTSFKLNRIWIQERINHYKKLIGE